jgi:cell division protein ZapA|tara:strand:+ start:1066 stop:1356 length:291 start_codon:yes stop_codon:yes gene_type:complete
LDSKKLSIKLHIANRIYPLKIDRSSEEYIRNAVKKIEKRLKFYEDNYAIKDKQDLLAMCLIEYASKSESINNKTIVEDNGLTEKLTNIQTILDNTF